MATDFFERQDIARRNTGRLVLLFGLAVLAIMVSIYLLLAATMGYLNRNPQTGAIDWSLANDLQLLGISVVGTLVVVGGGGGSVDPSTGHDYTRTVRSAPLLPHPTHTNNVLPMLRFVLEWTRALDPTLAAERGFSLCAQDAGRAPPME